LICPVQAQNATLATALGGEAVKAGGSVFSTSWPICSANSSAPNAGADHMNAPSSLPTALFIVDEIGYLPVVHGGGNLLFQPVAIRRGRGAITLTSNCGFVEYADTDEVGHGVKLRASRSLPLEMSTICDTRTNSMLTNFCYFVRGLIPNIYF
jgi:hypothetical protein